MTSGWVQENSADLVRANMRFVGKFIEIQASWLSAWWSLQDRWMSETLRRPGELPAWMVWHNGTEQLA
jgi:hypothetical protein